MTEIIKKTVAASGGNFTKVQDAVTWFIANYPNFVTSDIIGEIEIAGSWASADTTPVYIGSGSIVTDTTHYIYIHTTGLAKHSGVWSETAYRLFTSDSNAFRIEVCCRVDGLQIKMNAYSAANKYALYLNTPEGGESRASNMLLIGNLDASVPPNLVLCYGQGHIYLWNIIGYDAGTYGLHFDGNGYYYCYNSVFIGGSTAAVQRTLGNAIVKNVCAGGATADYSGTMTKTTCASSDTTGSEGLQNIAVDTNTFKNVTSGTEDFHLANTDSPLYHTGTDTSGDDAPMNFTTDIDDDNYYDTDGKRSIGADEIEFPGGWVEYYTPYTYPHPLRTILGDTTPPPPPPPPVVIEESNYFDLSDSIGASIIIHAKGENESANGTITFIFSFYKPDINGVWHYVDSDPYIISLNGINDVCATFVIPYDVRKIQLKSIEYDDDETNSALVNVSLNKLCFDNFEQADSLVSSLKAVINEQKRPKV